MNATLYSAAACNAIASETLKLLPVETLSRSGANAAS